MTTLINTILKHINVYQRLEMLCQRLATLINGTSMLINTMAMLSNINAKRHSNAEKTTTQQHSITYIKA